MAAWSVVTTHRDEERRAAAHLERQGFKHYLPLCQVERVVKSRREGPKVVHSLVPLFEGYLFVVIKKQWQTVRNTRGVARILMDGELPARVPTDVIEDIRSRETTAGYVDLVEAPPEPVHFERGQALKVTGGHLSGHSGIYLGKDGKERVRVLLTLLNRKVRVDIDQALVAAA